MSSRSRCAVDITAKFIDMATKQHGGLRLALSHSGRQMLYGARHTRSREVAVALEPVSPSMRPEWHPLDDGACPGNSRHCAKRGAARGVHTRETNERAALYDARERRIVIADATGLGFWVHAGQRTKVTRLHHTA